MSVFGAFYTKNHISFVTDTIGVQKNPLIKNGKLLDETVAAVTSKTLYFPHFQAAVCSMGLTALSTKVYQFIDQIRGLHDMDSFLKAMRSDFVDFYQKDKEAMAIQYPDAKPNWLGCLVIVGSSTFQGNESENYEGERSLKLIKAMVWKDKIEFKLINILEEREFDFAFMPRLADEAMDKILSTDWSEIHNNQIEGALIEHMKALKVNYDESLRKDYMVGGELNLTSMTLQNDTILVIQKTVYRFPDFLDNLEEIEDFHKRTN